MSRIGVFVCHCGTNIAGTVDVEAVADAARARCPTLPTRAPISTCARRRQDYIVEVIKASIIPDHAW